MKCTECGNKMIRIIYGLPSPEMFEGNDKREIRLGGCVVTPDSPKWECGECDG